MKYQSFIVASFLLSGSLLSCSNDDTKPATKTTETDTATKETVAADISKIEPAEKPAIINIVDTISAKRIIICFKDSAATMERVSAKLGLNYGKIGEILKKSNLKADGAPMAWYKGDKAPIFLKQGYPLLKRLQN